MKQDVPTTRVALITGPTAGLGKAIALALAKLGYQLVLLGRNPAKLQAVSEECIALGAPAPHLLVADMASQTQVRAAAAQFIALGSPLHVLINNAGVMNRHRQLTEDNLEETMAVAYWSTFLLTMLLLPCMKASAPATIINTASDTYPFGKIPFSDPQWTKRYFPLGPYAAAKKANVMWTLKLAELLKPERIGVNVYNPGPIDTDIGGGEEGLLAALGDKFFRLIANPISKGIIAPVELATAEHLDAITGHFYNYNKQAKVKRSVLDASASQKLWELSTSLTGNPVPDFLQERANNT